MQLNIENQNNDLTKLMNRIQEQRIRTADILPQTQDLQFRTVESSVTDNKQSQIVIEGLRGEPTRIAKVNDVCFNQIASKADIDVRTAKRLRDSYSFEFDKLINAIWQKENSRQMIRMFDLTDSQECFDYIARAFLSDKFKTFDNVDLLESTLPSLNESGANWQIVNSAITDKKLFVRFKSKTQVGEGANVGDHMANGIVLSNSEVGLGSVTVGQIVWTLACTNGMQTENKTRSSHITSSRQNMDQWSMLSTEAKNADNKALSLKLRDIVGSFASRESFDQILDQMKQASSDIIEGEYSISKLSESVGEVLKVPQKQRSLILDGLAQTLQQDGYVNQPMSRATVLNGVTAVASKVDADSVDDWQKLGGSVLNMSASNWNKIKTESLKEVA